MCFAWTSGRALRAGEDLDIAALPVQTGAAHSPRSAVSPDWGAGEWRDRANRRHR
jgi:hypothetical protein